MGKKRQTKKVPGTLAKKIARNQATVTMHEASGKTLKKKKKKALPAGMNIDYDTARPADASNTNVHAGIVMFYAIDTVTEEEVLCCEMKSSMNDTLKERLGIK